MSSTNAPQPDALGPAEVFDSTVAPAQGQVSQDQLPGGNTSEAPVHTGQVNGIDPFFYDTIYATHFFCLGHFSVAWTTFMVCPNTSNFCTSIYVAYL